ncbi:MAG: class I SAM-dependent methyltransferase [Phyllobacteriaceae bacterium]|nr:class I SAM-dependent methyltransferase [Phyllobacteriaceae bacterium]
MSISETRPDRANVADRSSGRFTRALNALRDLGPGGVVALLRKHGLSGAWDFLRRNVRHLVADRLARRWDARFNVDTAGSIQLDALDVIGPNASKGNECVCTSPKSMDFILDQVGRDLSRHTFIDIGCGKGRTLLLASRFPFTRVIGVEFARELCAIARRNVADFIDPAQKCRAIDVIEADATTYEFPGGPLFVYFYNPFSKDLFQVVIANLEASLRANPRDCILVYGSSSHNAIGWARPAILKSGLFSETPSQPMPGFLDAVRIIDYAMFANR